MNKEINSMDKEFSMDEDFSIWDILNTKDNFIKFLLLLLVPVIIYIVDHISNINAIIFSFPSPVIGLPVQNKIKIPKKRLPKK
jgi:hypothetical protein